MSSTTAIVIHWFGPYYSVDELEGGPGLYMLTGQCRYERENQIQYIGKTNNTFQNRLRDHHKLWQITRNLEIWLGEMNYPANAGDYYLDMAETILIYFWWPKLNQRKLYTPPRPTSLISHWFTPTGQPRANKKTLYRELYDVLCWDEQKWRVGNLRLMDNEYP